ncbi:hypothetical protein FFZ99_07790 [Leptospira interrogans]|uniref:Uncharacterized protein n=1 Tax=Leptospira interrogans serovar Pomona TaxID=44276 RepID=A0AA40WBW4_LEPIR|nr:MULTISPECIES: hypothetical protein [Leptospira]EJO77123.1 hypothetical protein LEP1GSC045_2324 [Leptospira interrogans serovar Pomona str. Kennewicki LC82-25]EKN96927.1 hypothetical protein LEP1GSC014_0906 [Leptospira interrogans serovar Pomona str. Pomona]EKO68891.1 hypothetical protein LEP1GSC069_3786 [Leptospira interrogans serovar Canicola str. Fiocruz LV133]EKR35221.1 hypothetical protein LEP1GSC096_1204 [Leptospira interrogans serovar Hebdomadis str. R499]EKR82480.1 hypothetical prote
MLNFCVSSHIGRFWDKFLKNDRVKNRIQKIIFKSKVATVKEHAIDFCFCMSMGKKNLRLNLPELYF